MSAKNVVPIGIRSPDCPARNEWDQRKVKWCRYRPGVAQRVGRGIALLFHDRGTRRGEWSAAHPGRTLPPGKDPVPIWNKLTAKFCSTRAVWKISIHNEGRKTLLNSERLIFKPNFFLYKSIFLFLWRCGPKRAMASSFLGFLDHTQRRITVGRTPLDAWWVRRRDLYLTTHNTHNRQTSMPPAGFEPTFSAGERP